MRRCNQFQIGVSGTVAKGKGMAGMETGLISQRKNFILQTRLGIKSQCSSAVEQRFRKPSVAGSIPAIGSIFLTVAQRREGWKTDGTANVSLKMFESGLREECTRHSVLFTGGLQKQKNEASSNGCLAT